jgi:hypothetical protein
MPPDTPSMLPAPSEHASAEQLVNCLHALYAISDHIDVDCDGECVEGMRDRAREALDILLGKDWTYRDLERVVVDLRSSHA